VAKAGVCCFFIRQLKLTAMDIYLQHNYSLSIAVCFSERIEFRKQKGFSRIASKL